jgi:hypothetical protein
MTVRPFGIKSGSGVLFLLGEPFQEKATELLI